MGRGRKKERKIIGKSFGSLKISRTFASLLKRKCNGRLAQLVQSVCLTSRGSAVRIPYKQRVGGSNPSTSTSNEYTSPRTKDGRLAQLVQSVCLTSRGSAVRIRQRPLLNLICHNIEGSLASDLWGYFFVFIRRGSGRLLLPCARVSVLFLSLPYSVLAGSAGAG